MSNAKNDNIFDPTDLGPEVVDIANGETGELVTPQETPESAYIPDTSADPEGSEERARPDAIQLPDYFFKRYAIDNATGEPTFNPSIIAGAMGVFNSKKDTEVSFKHITDEDQQAKEADLYQAQVQAVIDGQLPLLEVDAPTTGINLLQLNTRTWAEFASIAYEYQDSAESANPNEDLPIWLIEREDKMFQLGRKARMIRDAINQIDDKFGLKDITLNNDRVQKEIERRAERLAKWNYDNAVNRANKVATDMNVATREHTKNMFDCS